jgi:hypothetical protein
VAALIVGGLVWFFTVGKGSGQGFPFFQICGIQNLANSSKNLTKLVECTPQKKKKKIQIFQILLLKKLEISSEKNHWMGFEGKVFLSILCCCRSGDLSVRRFSQILAINKL